MSLPDALQSAITLWLGARADGCAVRRNSAALTATYRAGGSSAAIDLGSYLVARLPATHAAVSRVLQELARLRPDLSPASLLDAGSGPGTASWAASQVWPDLEMVTFLDTSPVFLALAKELARQGPPSLASATAVAGSLTHIPASCAADLVIAAYALAELRQEQAGDVAAALWAASRSALVLVEPGTPHGFARLRLARQRLMAGGAVPVAPCTHAEECPIRGDDWCHFSVRLPRSRAHMHAKGARVPFEDERFAYLVMARSGRPHGGARIVAPPQQAKPGITFRVCREGLLQSQHVARRDAATYKQARKLDWGDLMSPATLKEQDR